MFSHPQLSLSHNDTFKQPGSNHQPPEVHLLKMIFSNNVLFDRDIKRWHAFFTEHCRDISDSEPSGKTGHELCQTLLDWSGFISL